MDFGRLSTAMVTAFDSKGELDLARQTQIIEHLIQTGSESLIVSGTTGESPTLSNFEKQRLYEHTLQVAADRVPVIAGTGSHNTEETIQLTQEAERIGVQGIMLVVPYYNKPSQEGLYEHFRSVAQNTNLPIMLYNVPGRTGRNMSADTVCRLAQMDNITCIKEASEDIGQITTILKETSDDFLVYSGDDAYTLPILSIGGHGVVSVASHVLGKEIKQLIERYVQGDVQSAATLYQDLYAPMKSLFHAPSPVPVKKVLAAFGVEAGPVRLPLVPLTTEQSEHILSHFSAYLNVTG